MGTNFFLRHHNLGDLLNHFADTTGSHLLKGSIYQGHIWEHRGKGKMQRFAAAKFSKEPQSGSSTSSHPGRGIWWGFTMHMLPLFVQHFPTSMFFSRIFKATFTVTTPSFEEKLRNHRPSSLVVRHSGIFRRQAALWASSAHWATDGVSGAENKPLGRWNWIGFNWLLCYWWEIKVNGICF